jgi:hypothetical protein
MQVTLKLSLWDDCKREIDCHKWIESQRAGYDKGHDCVLEWIGMHWTGYLRAKWLEHLQGNAFWIELDRGDFGILQHRFQDQALLLDRIVDRLKVGQENLHIIVWARDWHIPKEPVLNILEALDVNSARLVCKFHRGSGCDDS